MMAWLHFPLRRFSYCEIAEIELVCACIQDHKLLSMTAYVSNIVTQVPLDLKTAYAG